MTDEEFQLDTILASNIGQENPECSLYRWTAGSAPGYFPSMLGYGYI